MFSLPEYKHYDGVTSVYSIFAVEKNKRVQVCEGLNWMFVKLWGLLWRLLWQLLLDLIFIFPKVHFSLEYFHSSPQRSWYVVKKIHKCPYSSIFVCWDLLFNVINAIEVQTSHLENCTHKQTNYWGFFRFYYKYAKKQSNQNNLSWSKNRIFFR